MSMTVRDKLIQHIRTHGLPESTGKFFEQKANEWGVTFEHVKGIYYRDKKVIKEKEKHGVFKKPHSERNRGTRWSVEDHCHLCRVMERQSDTASLAIKNASNELNKMYSAVEAYWYGMKRREKEMTKSTKEKLLNYASSFDVSNAAHEFRVTEQFVRNLCKGMASNSVPIVKQEGMLGDFVAYVKDLEEKVKQIESDSSYKKKYEELLRQHNALEISHKMLKEDYNRYLPVIKAAESLHNLSKPGDGWKEPIPL